MRIINAYRTAFSGLPRNVWLLAFALFVNRSGAMVLPFLSLYVTKARGLPDSTAALVLVAYGLGSIVGSWTGGNLCHRFGALRVQQVSLALSGCTYLAIPYAPSDPRLLAAVVALASFVADAFRPSLMAAVADAAPDAVRARALALVRLAANLGFSLGPSVGGVLASIDYFWLFVGDAVTSWLACLVLLRFLDARAFAPHVDVPGTTPRRSEHRDGPFLGLLAVTFVLTLALFQTFSTLPLYLSDAYGLPERTIGLLLGFNGLLIVLCEMLIVQRVERLDRLRVVAAGTLLLCSGLALFPFGRGALYALGAMAVLTCGEMLCLPMTNALAADRGGERARGAYMGLYSASFSASFVVAPALGMFLYHRFGGTALWLAAGSLGPVLAVGCLSLRRVFTVERSVELTGVS